MKWCELVEGETYVRPIHKDWDPPSQGPFRLIYRGATQAVFEDVAKLGLFIEPQDSRWISELILAPKRVKRWVLAQRDHTSPEIILTWIYSSYGAAATSNMNGPRSKIHEIEIEI